MTIHRMDDADIPWQGTVLLEVNVLSYLLFVKVGFWLWLMKVHRCMEWMTGI